ncbi:MAG: hypothetical protein V7677_19370 [Motiliproteus sp.]
MKVICRYLPDAGSTDYDDSILVLDFEHSAGRLSEDGESFEFSIERINNTDAALHWRNESPIYPSDNLIGLGNLTAGEFLTRTDGRTGESWDYVIEQVSS